LQDCSCFRGKRLGVVADRFVLARGQHGAAESSLGVGLRPFDMHADDADGADQAGGAGHYFGRLRGNPICAGRGQHIGDRDNRLDGAGGPNRVAGLGRAKDFAAGGVRVDHDALDRRVGRQLANRGGEDLGRRAARDFDEEVDLRSDQAVERNDGRAVGK